MNPETKERFYLILVLGVAMMSFSVAVKTDELALKILNYGFAFLCLYVAFKQLKVVLEQREGGIRN